jgi:uncharacterized protein YneF (UPF0154 family)
MELTTLLTWIICILVFGFIGWLIVTQIEEFKLQDDPKLRELKEILIPMFRKDKKYNGLLTSINNRNILNEVGLYKGNKSYTINKQKIFLCLKDENGLYYPNQQLIYVLLHEISHVICTEVGHTELFNQIFDELLLEAEKMKIFDPNYEIIQNYCNY